MKSSNRRFFTSLGFTLIELLVVMAIIATLASIAAPRYFNSLEKTRETTLHANLKAMREAIDQYYQDRGVWPVVLEDLVKHNYLREIPVDPVTRESNTWVPVRPAPSLACSSRSARWPPLASVAWSIVVRGGSTKALASVLP